MVRSYLKYEHSQSFGVVTSASSNAVWASSTTAASTSQYTDTGRAYVGANEEVLCWDIKKGELISRWCDKDCVAAVTAIARSIADPDIFAVGYGDGSIRLWDSTIATVIITFNGHRSAVTTLAFDRQSVRLASGSKDTDIVVWDLVAEAGLFKLRGHKDQITGLHFLQLSALETGDLENGTSAASRDDVIGYLLSTSKDATIKIWDVVSQYCLETHITQSNGECWALGVSPDETGCITAGNDGELKIWSVDVRGLASSAHDLEQAIGKRHILDRGTLKRQSTDRTIGISFHPKADYFAVHGSEKAVELWRVRTSEEVQRRLTRKRKRKREKTNAAGQKDVNGDTEMLNGDHGNEDLTMAGMDEFFVPHVIIRTGGKVRSIHWAGGKPSKGLQLLVATSNNQLELYHVSVQERTKKSKIEDVPEYTRTVAVELPGHRTDVRAACLSSDDRMLATASSGSLKIWNMRTQSCIRTLECGYALCSSFIPGDQIVILGTKSGHLELFDINSATSIETIQAHKSAIWTLRVHPDGRSIVTGSADKSAKFWKFEVDELEISGTKRTTSKLRLVHTRTLKMTDDVLNLCFSPDSRLLAVSTLDNTVKVFFVDTLKLFLNLYGHKLPVLHISISSDSKIIATCSADKNVRLWGLDFGDCHKAFFAHDESIMQVSFIPHPILSEDGHLFFSASKDGLLKSWDGDKFEQIQKLTGHHGEIWAMVVSKTGDCIVTVSHDKSIRIWSRTDEPLFLEEERDRELEEMYEINLATSLDKDQNDEYAALGGSDGADRVAVVPASKQTTTTLTAGERITEALTICTGDLALMSEHEGQTGRGIAQRHPVLAHLNVSAERYLLSVFEAVPSAALQDALLVLSFSIFPSLFVFLSIWLQQEMNVSLTCRILFFLLKTHHKQIVASRELRVQLGDIRPRLRDTLEREKSVMGFNMAATKILGSRMSKSKIKTIEDIDQVAISSGKKRGFINVA